MPASNQIQIDMQHFLAVQRRERYRAFILHGPPLAGKTLFARRLSELFEGGAYWSVLQHVLAHPALAQCVDVLDARALHALVLTQATDLGVQLLLVDEVDFLVHVWDDDMLAFLQMVEKLSSTRLSATIGFVLQTQPALLTWTMTNTYGQSRILPLEAIQALETSFGVRRQNEGWREGAEL
jgi:hypothetical protein